MPQGWWRLLTAAGGRHCARGECQHPLHWCVALPVLSSLAMASLHRCPPAWLHTRICVSRPRPLQLPPATARRMSMPAPCTRLPTSWTTSSAWHPSPPPARSGACAACRGSVRPSRTAPPLARPSYTPTAIDLPCSLPPYPVHPTHRLQLLLQLWRHQRGPGGPRVWHRVHRARQRPQEQRGVGLRQLLGHLQ